MFINARRCHFLLVPLICAAAVSAHAQSPLTSPATGRISLDVVVTPKSGPPVSGLQEQVFTLLDNKAAQTFTSFQAIDGRRAPVEVIFVLDDVNTGVERIAYERSEMDKLLRADGGHLAHATALAFLTDSGIKVQDDFSNDGNALSASLHQYSVGLHSIRRSEGIYGASERFQVSVQALFQLATREASRSGRKIILWVSPGWPLLSGPGVEEQIGSKQQQQIFKEAINLSTLLRQGRITLYSVDPLGSADFGGRAFYWEAFVKGLSKPDRAEYGDIALQVIATQSGGLALTGSNDIAGQLQKCLADTGAYYEISFDPPQGDQPHEYHRLEVHIAKPGLTARTRQGYYSQP
jgi:VWFA-related protein